MVRRQSLANRRHSYTRKRLNTGTSSNDGNSEKKSITAYSLEKEFEDKNWLNFKCNTGDKDSLEQVAENNLNELGYAKEFVTFYNKNNVGTCKKN